MSQKMLSIQVLRAIAFLMIFLSHVELIATGAVGVSLFLIISGFCMSYSYLDKPKKTPVPSIKACIGFSLSRVKKLYPLHFVTLVCVAIIVFLELIIHNGARNDFIEQGLYFVANGLLLQSWIPWRDGYYSFNAVSWYLSTSAFSYCLFPWVFQIYLSHKRKGILALSAAVLCIMIVFALCLGAGQRMFGWSDDFLRWTVYINPVYRFGDFVLGLTAGYVFITAKQKIKTTAYSVAELIVLLLIVIQVIVYNRGMIKANHWKLTLFWLPTSIACVYLFASKQGIVTRLLSKSKALVWLGNLSGEAFLIHQICIKAVETAFSNRIMIAIIAFILTFICTFIWRWLFNKCRLILK